MSTIELADSGTLRPSRHSNVKTPYLVEKEIDFAVATTAKGSALAANDIIEAIRVPANTLVLWAGMQVKEEMTGTSTDLALDLGVTSNDPDRFVDGFDYDGASEGDWATVAAAATTPALLIGETADTIDILIQAQTNTFTGGTIRVVAQMVDVSDAVSNGIAALGS